MAHTTALSVTLITMRRRRMNNLLLLLLLLISSCTASTTPAVNLPESAVVRANLVFKIDGVVQYGSGMLWERKPSYKIEVYTSLLTPEKPLKIFLTTCHRAPDPFFGFKSNDVWTYQYYPVVGLEDTGSCLVFITVLTESGLRHIGIIDLRDPSQTLPIRSWGNGNFYNQGGAVFMQALEKTVQTAAFNEPVRIIPGNNCNDMIEAKDPNTGKVIPNSYQFQAPLGLCVYLARGKESGKLGKITVRGFSSSGDK